MQTYSLAISTAALEASLITAILAPLPGSVQWIPSSVPDVVEERTCTYTGKSIKGYVHNQKFQ